MDIRRDSLPLRILAELRKIFRIPNSRRRTIAHTRLFDVSRNATPTTPRISKTLQLPSTPANSSRQADQSSDRIGNDRQIRLPPRPQTPLTVQRPFSRAASTTVILAPSAQRPVTPRPRRAERIKSIKRHRPLNTRSASTFFLDIGHSRPGTSSQLQNQNASAPRSASVDDLLETATNDTSVEGLLELSAENRRSRLGLNQSEAPPTQQVAIRSGQESHVSPIAPAPNRRSSIDILANTFSNVSMNGSTQASVRQSTHERPESRSSALFASTTSLDSRRHSFEPRRVSMETAQRHRSPSNTSQGRLNSIPSASTGTMLSVTSISSNDFNLSGLRLRERVVWFTDNDVAQPGIIKWLGKINGKETAGVEFDNPVGNSSGKWNGRQLFTAQLTRGRFVPIAQLILYADYAQRLPCNEPAKIEYRTESNAESSAIAAIICVICQDSLLSYDGEETQQTKSDAENCTISTQCGHLFHKSCLTQWFSIKKIPTQPCPYCQRPIPIDKVIRIYPVQGK